jgi:Zn-dependent protease
MDIVKIGHDLFLYFIPFLFALCFHEYAHGWVARLKGDRTAELAGRLTLNPMVHIDPIGTLLLPIMAILTGIPFFGWAKPVPVDERNLKDRRNDMFWIALAGPLSNVFLAFVGAIGVFIVLHTAAGESAEMILSILVIFVQINFVLAIFNLIPLHPLDGGKVFARFLPYAWNRKLEEVQGRLQWVLFAVFILGGFRFLAIPATHASNFLLSLAGLGA